MPDPAGTRRPPSRPVPPRLLDPILARWERFDRRRSHIRSVREGGVLGLQLSRYRGARVELADGVEVEPGDPIGLLHFQNWRAADVVEKGWQGRGFREGRLDLAELAAWASRQPAGRRPVAYTGTTIVWPIARRVGFEIRTRPRTWRTRLDDWFMRWLIAHWSPYGRSRLERGHGRLQSNEVWLSDRTLRRLYGAGPNGPE